ncbi:MULTISPECIES: T9SS type A sorting domain-containing protein [Melioribacter]
MLYQYSNYSGSSRDARYNYWGGSAPAVEGTVNYTPYLTTPHANVGPDWTLSKKSFNNKAVDENNPLADAWKEYFNKNYTKSKEMAKALFQSRNTEEQSCEILFLWMKSAMREGTLKEEENTLLSINKDNSIYELTRYESLRWLSKLAVSRGEFKKAEEYALSIPNTSLMGREILFDVASEIMNKWGDIEKAESILDKLTERYDDNETYKEKQFVIGLYNKKNIYSRPNKKEENQNIENISNLVSLSEAYPNPFNPTTVISYSIPNDSKVTLKVFDILGREVTTLVNEVKPAGTYQVNFNGNNLSSGIYIYSLITDKQIITKKMLLIK